MSSAGQAIIWSAAHEPGVVPMDDTHRASVGLDNAFVEALDGEFLAQTDALLAHTEIHFDQENLRMDATGFPPAAVHKGEHERVLAALRRGREGVAAGDLAAGREAIAGIPGWFGQHVATVDAAQANWIRRMGWQPTAVTASRTCRGNVLRLQLRLDQPQRRNPMMTQRLASLLAVLLALTATSAFACPGDKARQGIQSESAPMTPAPTPPKI